MADQVLTVVTAQVDPSHEAELIAGFSELVAGGLPDGLLRSELQQGQEGTWRVESLWSDLDTLRTLRASGARPAALELCARLGTEHSHAAFTVRTRVEARARVTLPETSNE